MTKQEAIDGIVELCKKSISCLEEKVTIAWDEMDQMRCPLSMTGGLADEIQEYADEWFEDHDLTEEEIEELDIDVEEDIFPKL